MNVRPVPSPASRIVRVSSLEAGNLRLVQRRHALYRVAFRPEATTIVVRPITEEARRWLAARGLAGLRITCPEAETERWIDRQERAISRAERSNIVAWRPGKPKIEHGPQP